VLACVGVWSDVFTQEPQQENGVIARYWHPHSSECDGMLTCVCPDTRYSFRVTDEYRDALEADRL
jgi:hypothetical protein